MTGLVALLANGKPLLLDGGLATELEAQGHDIGTDLWSAELLHSNPQAIVDAHRSFLDAGADCIISASYQASQRGLMTLGVSADEADELIRSSVTLADTARKQFLQDNPNCGRDILVAASVGPFGAAMHDGSEYTGIYNVSGAELRDFHAQRLALLDSCGADVLACETIPNIEEAKVLHELLLQTQTPAWVSFACRDSISISDGSPLTEAVALFANHPNVLAVGSNCTAPQHVVSLIGHVKSAAPDKYIVAYPNSGESYDVSDNSWHGTVTPIECGQAAQAWREAGAQIIGGCCRMSPQHIAAMRQELS